MHACGLVRVGLGEGLGETLAASQLSDPGTSTQDLLLLSIAPSFHDAATWQQCPECKRDLTCCHANSPCEPCRSRSWQQMDAGDLRYTSVTLVVDQVLVDWLSTPPSMWRHQPPSYFREYIAAVMLTADVSGGVGHAAPF